MELRTALQHFLDEKGRLLRYPAKRKMKLLALMLLAENFLPGKIYTQEQINDLLNEATVFRDPATLRRELYNNRFLGRKDDGSAYWLESPQPTLQTLGLAGE